jgi:hypothetical protein
MQSPSYTNLRIAKTVPLAELPAISVAIHPAILNAQHIAKYIADVVSHCACKAGSLSLPVSQSNISIKKKCTQPLWRFLFQNGELGDFLRRRAHRDWWFLPIIITHISPKLARIKFSLNYPELTKSPVFEQK